MENNALQFVMSWKRGKILLYYDNYTFHKKHISNSSTSWYCSKYKLLKCPAHIKTEGGTVLKITGVHNHDPPVENKDYYQFGTKF